MAARRGSSVKLSYAWIRLLQALQVGEPHSFQWGTLYRSLLFALLFSGMRRTPV
jgi:hypothetical protein